jgi:phage shock protein A
MRFEESADPKVQLEQAIRDAGDQHRRLREQAGNVIANQKQTEMRLNRAIGELEQANGNARQALRMATEADRRGDRSAALRYNEAAESYADRLLALERDIDDLRTQSLEATNAANQAKAAVEQNAQQLKDKLAERQKLLSQLDRAKLQEQMNKAMATLSESVGQDVPTFDEVRQKIEARYAKAKGMAELSTAPADSATFEIEQAARKQAARSRLDEMRAELGLGAGQPPMRELEP